MTIKANMKTSGGRGKLYKLEAPGDEISVPGIGKFEYVCNKVGTGAVAGIPSGSETTGGNYVCGNKEITVSQGAFNGNYGIDITVIEKGKSPKEYVEMFGDKLRSGKERFHEAVAKHKPHLKSGSGEIDSVVTARGSVYKYLPDGRTQRYKKVTGELNDPQDILVFVPDYEWVKKNAPERGDPSRFNAIYGDNKTEYDQKQLEYRHFDGRTIDIIDKNGKIMKSNKEIAATKGNVFVAFIDKRGGRKKVDYMIPVFRKPVIGFNTYDTRIFTENGELMKEYHIGNKVTQIKYTSNYGKLKSQFARIKPGVKKLKGKLRQK